MIRSLVAQVRKSPLFRAAGIYGAANLLRQLLPVLLIPILTRHLTPADYGTVAMFGVLVNIFIPLVGVNTQGAVNRKYFDRDQLDFPAYVFNALSIVVIATLLIAAALVFGADLVSALTELPHPWLWAALALACAQSVTAVLLALQQAAAQAIAYSVMQVAQSLLVGLATLWFVVGLNHDWRGATGAQLLSGLLLFLVSCVLLVRGRWLHYRFDRGYFRHALAFGLPLVPHALAAIAIQMVDRLFVTHYAGLAQTGLYTLGYQLGMVIGLLEDAFNRAWQPWLFERLGSADERLKRNIVLFTYGYFVAIALAAVALGFVAPWLLSFIAPERFSGAAVYVVWIALGYAFNGMYKMVAGYVFYAERTGVLAWMTMISAAVNITMSYLLVPRYGPVGAAYAATLGFLCSFLLTWITAAKVRPMPWLAPLRFLRGKPRT